jgi:hypothetical protein
LKRLGFENTNVDEITGNDNILSENKRLLGALEQKNRILIDVEKRLKDQVEEK